jgi:hypothetical protein
VSQTPEFERGRWYFTLSYYDEKGQIPLIETIVFIGMDLMDGDQGNPERTWYFKNPDNFLATGYQLTVADYEHCVRYGEDSIELVIALPQLIAQLSKEPH